MMDRLHELAVRNRRLRAVNIELEHLLGVSVPSALVQDLAALDSASFDHFFAVCSASMNASGRAPPSEREARRLYAACTTSRAECEVDVCNTSAVGEPSLSGDERIHSTEGRRADPHDSLGRDPCPPVAMRRGSFESTLASVPTASYRSLQRSSRTIEDFCKTYLPFLELHWQDVIFQIMPILVYVESTIYQIDEANELAPSVHGVCTRRGGESEGDSGGLSTEAQDIWDTLIKVLKEQGLWTPQIAGEMRCGLEYWRLERRLKASAPEPQPLPPSHTAQGHVNDACGDPCGPVCTLHAQAAGSGGQLVLTEKLIQDAVGHKSFDYRVLNLVLHRLLKKAPASTHLAFLRCSELLTEIEDDLTDYEEDVERDTFNTYRLYIRLHGPKRAPEALAAWISRLESQLHSLQQELPKHLSDAFVRRCRQAMQEAGPGGASYCMPAPIQDEEGFRRRLHASRSCVS